MAYRYGDRYQKTLFPQSIDEYVPNDGPKKPGPFDHLAFKYIPQEDVYICPTGHKLSYLWNN
jgi:hypothetical protein